MLQSISAGDGTNVDFMVISLLFYFYVNYSVGKEG